MLWQWEISDGMVFESAESPTLDNNGKFFHAADTLAEAIERWIVREEFREELRKGE